MKKKTAAEESAAGVNGKFVDAMDMASKWLGYNVFGLKAGGYIQDTSETFEEYRNLRDSGLSREETVSILARKVPMMILSSKADDYIGKNSRIDGVLYGKHHKNTSEPKPLQNANGDYIIEVKKSELYGEPNSITQVVQSKGGIDRNYYGDDGHQIKQISNYGHGHNIEEAMGKHGEHAHDYEFNERGKLEHQPARELTYWERKENEDIL